MSFSNPLLNKKVYSFLIISLIVVSLLGLLNVFIHVNSQLYMITITIFSLGIVVLFTVFSLWATFEIIVSIRYLTLWLAKKDRAQKYSYKHKFIDCFKLKW